MAAKFSVLRLRPLLLPVGTAKRPTKLIRMRVGPETLTQAALVPKLRAGTNPFRGSDGSTMAAPREEDSYAASLLFSS